jgi:aryl-alcohol dehydrogenase-like predicted oxidoreductase
MDRRTFLKLALATSFASSIPKIGVALASDDTTDIPRRALGKTGEQVSIVGIGGFHLGKASSNDEATRIVRTAVDHGINFMDNCWDYNEGLSETRMGNALTDGYRNKVFLMTKIDGRDEKTATAQLEESLKRLKTDRVDLLQIHEIIRMEDPRRVFASGGAIEALVEAKKAGKIRFIGFTGHKSSDIHLSMLKTADDHGFRFDAVQMPLNVMDAHTQGFEKRVLPVLMKKQIGVLGMKPMGSGIILKSGVVEAPECLRYTMSLPTSVVITGCESIAILEQALGVARGFRPLDVAARERILAKTAAFAKDEQYELYKTSTHFDGTTHNPKWLG